MLSGENPIDLSTFTAEMAELSHPLGVYKCGCKNVVTFSSPEEVRMLHSCNGVFQHALHLMLYPDFPHFPQKEVPQIEGDCREDTSLVRSHKFVAVVEMLN